MPTIFVNLVPVAAITLGVLLQGERLTPAMLAGAVLVVSGVWIIHRPSRVIGTTPLSHPRF